MSNSNLYGKAIWTNHALDRLLQRGLTQQMANDAFTSPDRQFPGKQQGTTEFQKRYGPSLVTIIGKQNEKAQWIILSCWIDPPLPGSIDVGKKDKWRKFQKSSGWKRFFLMVKNQILGHY